jgi:branched-chain amino acid transport system permease protein
MSNEGLFWINLLVDIGIFVLLAVSLNLINGYAGMFHLGHHGFWALGAYAAAATTLAWPGLPGPILFLASIFASVLAATIGGLVIGIPCLRLRGDYLAIATLGFGEIVWRGIATVHAQPIRVPRILMDVNLRSKANFRLLFLGIVGICCLLAIWGIRNFIRSSPGRRLLAVAQDETAAGLLGINPTRSKVVAFAVGSAIAGLAGGLYAHYVGSIAPEEFNFLPMVMMFLIIVLGGMGSLSGCVVGAVLVIGTERLLQRTSGPIYAWWPVEFPLLLALLIIFRPQGIFGRREITDLWRRTRSA